MAATVEWSETNGAGAGVVTDGISPSVQFAKVDAHSNTLNLAPNNTIDPGSYSFEKWMRMHVLTAAPNTLGAFSVYFGQPFEDGAGQPKLTAKFAVNHAFRQPISTVSDIALTDCATAHDVASAVAFAPPANAPGAYSGYVIMQALVAADAAQGVAAIMPALFLNAAWSWT